MSREVVVIAGARTAFGKFMGGFSKVSAVDLAAHVTKASLERANAPADQVDHVIFGNVIQSSADAIYLARHAGLKAGIPIGTPAVTVNRLCGSGLEAIVQAARQIQNDEADLIVAGGAENMSQAPFVVRGARDGLRLGSAKLEDYLWEALYDPYGRCTMAGTANNLAKKYSITREDQDEFSHRSQQLATKAQEACRFQEEIVPYEIETRKGTIVVDKDEHPRGDTTIEGLGKLPLAPFEGNEYVTAGNASGINDGAAAVVVTSRDKAEQLGVKPMGVIKSWATVGVDPAHMGIGPAPASREAAKRAGMSVQDLDLIEINEAFAGQYLACERELEIDRDRVNVNGGAIALGHPLGASGARLTLTVLTELKLQQKQFGLASLCIGGGQGIAAVFESVQ